MSIKRYLAPILLSLFLAPACTDAGSPDDLPPADSPEGGGKADAPWCDSDAWCPGAQVCRDYDRDGSFHCTSRNANECRRSSDCGGGRSCVNKGADGYGWCKATSCTKDSNCGGTKVCRDYDGDGLARCTTKAEGECWNSWQCGGGDCEKIRPSDGYGWCAYHTDECSSSSECAFEYVCVTGGDGLNACQQIDCWPGERNQCPRGHTCKDLNGDGAYHCAEKNL